MHTDHQRGGTRVAAARVVVVAGVRLYRDGLSQVLADEAGLRVVGTAADGASAFASARELNPDVVLLDMDVDGSWESLRAIVAALPETKVVALGVLEGDDSVIECFEAGAASYVPRDASLPELVDRINSAARGEMPCSPTIAARLARRLAALAAELHGEQPAPALTSREAEVARLIDEGLSNKQIAQRLSIEVPTVKNHVHNILEKLKVSRRGEAAARLRRSSLVHASPLEVGVPRD